MSGTDDVAPPEDPARRTRRDQRAVLGGIAGVALLVGPIALANAVVPDGDDDDVTTEDQAPASVADRAAGQPACTPATPTWPGSPAGRSLRTTTTTAPPTTTTTAPPTTTTTATAARPRHPPPPPTADPAAPPPAAGSTTRTTPRRWDRLAQCESGGNWADQHRQRLLRRPPVLAVEPGRASVAPATRTSTPARRRSPWASASGRARLGCLARLHQQARLPLSPHRWPATTTRVARRRVTPRGAALVAPGPDVPGVTAGRAAGRLGRRQTKTPVSLPTSSTPPPATKCAWITSASWSAARAWRSRPGGNDSR